MSNSSIVRVAVIGFGYWGPNMVRNFNAQNNAKVVYVVDFREERLRLVRQQYPSIQTTNDVQEVFRSTDVDAVIIATPVFTHYDLARQALESGKHVLVEKPMVAKTSQGEHLIELAQKMGKVLMVDHTFLYTGAVGKIKSLIDDGSLGKIQYVDSTRINLGLFQPDVNVLWDLAAHDISVLLHLVREQPHSVQAVGISHTNNEIENIAYLTMNYQSDMIAHFSCSWASPVKIRKFLIGGDKKMVVYDDMEPTEKIKVYDTSYTYSERQTDEAKRQILVDYRVGDIFVPKLSMKEALAGVAEDFLKAITQGTTPISDAQLGLLVVKVLEASQISIKNKGSEVVL